MNLGVSYENDIVLYYMRSFHIFLLVLQLENNQIDDKGYAEVIVGADEVGIAASPQRTAHALVNVDSIHSTFFVGCQDGVISYNTSTSDFNVWEDL